MLDRNITIDTSLTPDGDDPDARQPAAPHRRFRHARRSARLCRQRPPRDEFPRRARHAGARLSLCRTARRRARPCPPLRRRSASPRATASRWSPRPAPNSPPASSARSMPGCGRCRCRCRPASAGATPMSTNWSSCCRAATRRCSSSRPSWPNSPPPPPRQRGVAARDWDSLGEIEPSDAPTCPPPTATTSAICNIRAARPASRTASRSPTAPCSTISHAHGIGVEVQDTDRVRQLAALVS